MAEKIVPNLIRKYNSLKSQFIKKCVIFGDNQFMSKLTFHTKHPQVDLFHLDLLYMLICYKAIRYVLIIIFNM